MASEAQQTQFSKAVKERQFPAGTDTDALEKQFAELSGPNASEWLERAWELPRKGKNDDGSDKPYVKPTF